MADKSKGQAVLEAWAGWVGSFVRFPDVPSNQAIIMALWALHTWFAPRWPVTCYLHITSDGPGCGKTTLMEVLGALSPAARLVPTLRPLSVCRDIDDHGGVVTYFFDQVEALQEGPVTEERAILLSGYRKGGVHIASGKSFNVYSAKAFASIGDIASDLRSRVALVRLSWGAPSRDWSEAVMVRGGEAAILLGAARGVLPVEGLPAWVVPEFFPKGTREREIFTPLWSIAMALGLDADTLKAVRRGMEDMSEYKRTAETRSYRELVRAPKDERAEYAARALRDLASVLPEATKTHTGHLFSGVAVERMKELDGPWRVFQGRGLDVDTLASLLSSFGVKSEVLGMVKGRAAKKLNGYHRAKVLAALKALEASKVAEGGAA